MYLGLQQGWHGMPTVLKCVANDCAKKCNDSITDPAPLTNSDQLDPPLLSPKVRRVELEALIVEPKCHSCAPINLPASPDAAKLEQYCPTFQAGSDFNCYIEWDEWLIVLALVSPKRSVLELGARWGTTSCFLAQMQGNSGRLVVVEPQPEVHDGLIRIRDEHHCNFYVLKGVVGDHSAQFLASGYGSTTCVHPPCKGSTEVTNVQWNDLEAFVGFEFDTILFDCEGCIQDVLPLEEHQPLLKNIVLIMIEEDQAELLLQQGKYKHWHNVFLRAGFQCIWHSHDTFDPKGAAWSRNIRHRAWIRPERFGVDWVGCEGFAMRHNLGFDKLQCVGSTEGNPLYPEQH